MAEFRYVEFALVAAMLLAVVVALFVVSGDLGAFAGRYHGISVDRVENESAVDGRIVPFEELTPDQLARFERALREATVETPDEVDTESLTRRGAIRYEGALYRVSAVAS